MSFRVCKIKRVLLTIPSYHLKRKDTKMKIHFIIHESFESPAAIETWAKTHHHILSYTHLYTGELLSFDQEFDLLIIMGGPQSPSTTLAECAYFDAKTEINFIRQAIDKDKLVLGICLGAQLIGEALGAAHEHSTNKEIGVFNVKLTQEAAEDPFISHFPNIFNVAHWHSDMPGLTSEAKVLAKSEGCPRQLIRYKQGVYGFQCHFEFTRESIENMILHCKSELKDAGNLPYVQTEHELRKHDYSTMNQLLFQFLDSLQILINTTQNEMTSS